MHDLNRVQRIGHLGHDPEVTYTATGTARTTFSLTTSQGWKDADGQAHATTAWTRCIAWGTLAEVCAQYYVTKGSRVYVAGRLHTSRWADAQTDEQRSRAELIVDDLILLDRPMRPTTAENDQDLGESQPVPSTLAPAPHPPAPEPIRWSPQLVQICETSAQPAKPWRPQM